MNENKTLKVRQVGKVVQVQELIEWEDGSKQYVSLQEVPTDFLTYPVGQRFEAIVIRDLSDMSFICIECINKKSLKIQYLNPEEIQTIKCLPSGDWKDIPTAK